jgi:hypothetical protein
MVPPCDIYTVKKGTRDVANKTLPGRVWLLTSRLGTGKIANLFLQCNLTAHGPFNI